MTLPAFMWMDGCEHDTPTTGRNIICHVRTLTIMEVWERDNVVLKEGVISYNFDHIDTMGLVEKFTIAVHCSGTLEGDVAMLREVMREASKWYADWMDWEDNNIVEEDMARWN